MRLSPGLFSMLIFLGGCASHFVVSDIDPKEQVMQTERAFAKTMADRDLSAFSKFISDEAVFFSGDKANRGRSAIATAWAPLFKASSAPFSWSPAHVEVLESGQLALSTGPVLNDKGELVAKFSSIWRREPNGEWRIVFDKGCDVCISCVRPH